MVPWIGILVGALFVWLAVTIGFYEIWCLFINILISIYVAVFLAPTVIDLAPSTGSIAPYSTAMSMVVVAGGCFALLYGISYVFLTGQFSVPFPRTFDVLLAGGLGFLTGFLLLSFVGIVFTTTPLAKERFARTLGFNAESERANISCIARCCDVIHSLTGNDISDSPTKIAIAQLLDRVEATVPEEDSESADPNTPAKPIQNTQGHNTHRVGWAFGPKGST